MNVQADRPEGWYWDLWGMTTNHFFIAAIFFLSCRKIYRFIMHNHWERYALLSTLQSSAEKKLLWLWAEGAAEYFQEGMKVASSNTTFSWINEVFCGNFKKRELCGHLQCLIIAWCTGFSLCCMLFAFFNFLKCFGMQMESRMQMFWAE